MALRSALKSLANRAGYEVTRIEERSSMTGALERRARRQEVATVIDVGASDGRWSTQARLSYPHARFLLIEAQADAHGAALERLAASTASIDYVLAAAGDAVGETHFDASDAFSGVASRSSTGDQDIVVPMTTVDHEVDRLGLPGPYLLKLDTHGFEVPILQGAERTLGLAAVVIIEAYNFELVPGSLRFHELCTFMEERSLRVVDLVDTMRRPGDGSLWQFDLCFIRSDSQEFRSNTYA